MSIHHIFILLAMLLCSCKAKQSDPALDKSGFVQIHEVIPDVVYDIRYYSADNFVGTRVDGYVKPTAYISKEAAAALTSVQAQLKEMRLGLKIFDAYRPQKAVDHFVRWGKNRSDTLTKSKYYPDINKTQVFELGFVATKSGHTRGSTVDLTVIDLETGEELDMGSPWDFFGDISHHDSDMVDVQQTANRNLLRKLMLAAGFKEYANEWWHYTLKNEPYPATYFNFEVK